MRTSPTSLSREGIVTDQLNLFPPYVPLTEKERKFLEFNEENPTVYTQLRDLALKMRRSGRKHYGIGSLYEVLRWDRAISTTDPDFKLSNNHRAHYSRLLMKRESELAGFFRTHKIPEDEA